VAIRKSIRALNDTEKSTFIDAVLALKSEFSSADGLSTYNRYVLWHQMAMWQASRLGGDGAQTRRNAAHRGPAFLQWHREFLKRFELDLQRVAGSSDLGLPYWDWEIDGDKPVDQQPSQPVWDLIGGSGVAVNIGPGQVIFVVADGPFGIPISDLSNPDTFNPTNPLLTITAREQVVNGQVRISLFRSVLMRQLGQDTDSPALPTSQEVKDAWAVEAYVQHPWNESADNTRSFRNRVEGWPGSTNMPIGLHNRVHVWIGGSMGPGTSPNDPAFFLHHCNVDRIWSLWNPQNNNAAYEPQIGGPFGHSINDPMYPWDGQALPEVATVAAGLELGDAEYESPPSA
jgi:tyrosinase